MKRILFAGGFLVLGVIITGMAFYFIPTYRTVSNSVAVANNVSLYWGLAPIADYTPVAIIGFLLILLLGGVFVILIAKRRGK